MLTQEEKKQLLAESTNKVRRALDEIGDSISKATKDLIESLPALERQVLELTDQLEDKDAKAKPEAKMAKPRRSTQKAEPKADEAAKDEKETPSAQETGNTEDN